ncbi:MAG: sodium/proline symporter PutP [Gammaproteobacteria bacterium]|nr:sodium/proline symporter PutP [Gammaproteobacteria bacterium]
MMLIGYLAYRRTKNLSDYILGGRRLGSWVTALSACASDMSGWLLLGLPGYAYAAGLEAGWIALGLLIGTYFNWRLVAARLRHYSVIAGNSQTLPEFFEHRFHDKSHLLRVVSAIFILLFFLFYTSSGLVAGGKLFNAVFALPYHWAVTVGALVIVMYTFVGGFLAVSWTDLFQGLLMAVVLLIVPVIAIASLGGWDITLSTVSNTNPALLNALTNVKDEPLGFLAIVSLLAWGLGYFGQPHILARFKAIRSVAEIPAARRIAVTWVTITLLCAVLVGMVGIGYLQQPLQGTDTEKVFILLVEALFHPVIAGICLAAILAAIMSTADSQLLVSAAAFTSDFYKALFRRSASEQELIWTGRMAVLLIAIIALVLAWNPERKVLDLVAYAWAGFGAAFGPTLMLSLFWRRMNRYGALAGIIVGGLTVVIWKQLSGGLFDLYEIVPGFVFSMLSIVVTSVVTHAPEEAVLQDFDKASK